MSLSEILYLTSQIPLRHCLKSFCFTSQNPQVSLSEILYLTSQNPLCQVLEPFISELGILYFTLQHSFSQIRNPIKLSLCLSVVGIVGKST